VYEDIGVQVVDDKDQGLPVSFFLDGEPVETIDIDTSVAREYLVTYRVADMDGNESEATRTIIVGEPVEDEVPDPDTTQGEVVAEAVDEPAPAESAVADPGEPTVEETAPEVAAGAEPEPEPAPDQGTVSPMEPAATSAEPAEQVPTEPAP